ncbi:GH25 family lysozyme [Lentilactobacillus kisonensis]|uniref:Glycosyl hydrolase family 25 n=2 Tax=Lentilactobacillus kisonensis TaxID=481722 RepID=H1LH38_9LACO|nr:GH25 family lysozyme [Lentilactobacillus kisonensis]EHO50579.1 glycosyl hydrolase family 25 [Lentilactobacillus kisonensis F0435]KRL23140.1 glycosyl hydrolase family 25 [Lentilactobacillus kisonensis DSM 19906 = JCM 15041]
MIIGKSKLKIIILSVFTLIFSFSLLGGIKASASSTIIPDISEWQGKLSDSQVADLKGQVPFIINRRQYGANYVDKYATSNTNLYVKYGIPFGEYDYATFTSAASAKQEAKLFYQRSNKNAKFYVLDYEENNVKSGSTNAAVKAWYNEMRSLTNEKLIFYSYQSFATTYANTAKKSFDAQWIANYSAKPTIQTDLWQYSNKKYIPALKESVDASTILNSSKPVTWWVGGTEAKAVKASYFSSVVSSVTVNKKVYLYNSTTFTKANRVKALAPGATVQISDIKQRATGSYYFVTADGQYLTANKNYVAQ